MYNLGGGTEWRTGWWLDEKVGEALATSSGGEVLPLLGLILGSLGGGLDRWRPPWLVGGHLAACLSERMGRPTCPTQTALLN